MLRASALYIVIIISMVIAIFSASLIATAYFYRLQYQKNLRYNRLQANLLSGVAISLSEQYTSAGKNSIALYGEDTDSIIINTESWGLFDLVSVKSYTLADTLKKAFLVACSTSDDRAAIYLSDEDRPLSLSGSTQITGEAVLPKAGVKQAYVEGKPYQGKELVNGTIKDSGRKLPALEEARLSEIKTLLSSPGGDHVNLPDSLSSSFFGKVKRIQIEKKNALIEDRISGKIILFCDTVLIIKKTAILKDVILCAPGIVVEEGFSGTCQLFASDSIVAGKNTQFNYPSCIGIIKAGGSKIQARIALGEGSKFSGILFTYEKERSDLQTIISLGKNSYTMGEVYSSGYVKMEKPLQVEGKVLCNRFIIQTPTTLYENYLIDITINRNKRSPYYLTSPLMLPGANKAVLKWLD